MSVAWQRAGLIRRVVLVGVLLGCVGAAVLVVNWARKPRMALLYSGLAAEEAAKIVEKARDAGTPYELKDGGTTVYVPAEQVYSLRLTMAAQGLPTGDQAGYNILDQESFGVSPFKQQVNYKRAVEGELAKSIQVIDGVLSARVHVVRPESKLFARGAESPSATVVLKLGGGRRLTPGNIDAIVHLVAGGVEGLNPQHVVVVDSAGTLLTGATGDEFARNTGELLDHKTQIEEYLSRKAEGMLTAVLGPNRASVRVSAVLETSSLSTTKEVFSPDEKVVTKEEITSSSTTPAPAKDGAGASGASTKEEVTNTEYQVGRTIEEKIEQPGTVKSLSVAAFVDLSAATADAGDGSGGKAAGGKVTLEDITEILRNALGLSETDNLKVVDTVFNKPESIATEPVEAGFFTMENILLIARYASLGLLALAALVVLKMFGVRRAPKGQTALALEAQTAGGEKLLAAQGEIDPELIRARITHALQENPDEVKRLFLQWVQGSEGGS